MLAFCLDLRGTSARAIFSTILPSKNPPSAGGTAPLPPPSERTLIKVTSTTTGGGKLNAALKGLGKGGIKGFDVGFFASARYQDGTPVAAVAAWNEFGTRKPNGEVHIPSRPFMRNANEKVQPKLSDLIRREVDPLKMTIDRRLGEQLGFLVQAEYQQETVDLREPENAAITVEGGWMRNPYTGRFIYVKGKGSTNPLRDTGHMAQSVTFEVIE